MLKTIDPDTRFKIKENFINCSSVKDFHTLINETGILIFGNTYVPISYKSFVYHSYHSNNSHRYSSFEILKRNGKKRRIHKPTGTLNAILKIFNVILQCTYPCHNSAFGFVPDRSIVNNASLHVDRKFVYNIDLVDFFYSFNQNQIKLLFIGKPYGFFQTKESLAFFLSILLTHRDSSIREFAFLPQGSPASPYVTNMLCVRMDRRLSALAKRYNAKYTRYADDITFSGDVDFIHHEEFNAELFRIVENENLAINSSKTRLFHKAQRQVVTGLTVNKKVNVARVAIKDLRVYVHFANKYGLEKSMLNYKSNLNRNIKNIDHYVEVINGKFQYFSMVNNTDSLKKLRKKWNTIIAKSLRDSNTRNSEDFVKAVSLVGLKRALNLYNNGKTN